MLLLELRILEIHSFPHFSPANFGILVLSWNFVYYFHLMTFIFRSSVIKFCQSLAPFGTYNTGRKMLNFYAPAIEWQGGIYCLLCPSFRPSIIPSFRHSVLPVASKFVFSTPPTSLAWISMKLGTDVVPQVLKCVWGDNLCSTNFGRVMVLDT